MLFPNLQWPFSPLQANSKQYIEEATAALAAKEQTFRCKGSPLKPEALKDMIHMSYSLGKYASPEQRLPPTTTSPSSISGRTYSPMDID